MNPRLKRRLLTAVISGALVATGAVAAGPAYAAPVSAVGPVLADETSPNPTDTTTPPVETTAPPVETTAPPVETTAPPVDHAPTGTFKVNSFFLWVGQNITVTQLNIKDDGVADPANVKRLITWGDGNSTWIGKGWGAVGHKYLRAGHFPITLWLADPAGHTTAIKSTGPYITVPAAKYKVSANSVWPGQIFNLAISNVPTGTTKITVDEGDGYIVNLPGKSQTTRLYYYHRRNGGLVRGPVTIRVAFTNKWGTSSLFYAARPTVKTDSWTPVVKVTKPSGSNKASSWKTVKGTVTDKGSGAPYVYVWVAEQIGSKYYCFNKGWHLINSDALYNKYCYYGIPVKNVKGKWSLSVGGVKKGTFYVDARTEDWADRISAWSSIKVKITK